jgi:hypothetical protein
MRLFVFVVTIYLLAGCAGHRISGEVTAFHELSPSPGETIAVLPWRQQKKDSLEFKSYATVVEQQLSAKGYSVVPLDSKPALVAFLDYGIDDGQQVMSSYAIPHYGVTGYGSSYTTGTVTS